MSNHQLQHIEMPVISWYQPVVDRFNVSVRIMLKWRSGRHKMSRHWCCAVHVADFMTIHQVARMFHCGTRWTFRESTKWFQSIQNQSPSSHLATVIQQTELCQSHLETVNVGTCSYHCSHQCGNPLLVWARWMDWSRTEVGAWPANIRP